MDDPPARVVVRADRAPMRAARDVALPPADGAAVDWGARVPPVPGVVLGTQGPDPPVRTWFLWARDRLIPLLCALFLLARVGLGAGPVVRAIVGWARVRSALLSHLFTFICGMVALSPLLWGHVQPLWGVLLRLSPAVVQSSVGILQ